MWCRYPIPEFGAVYTPDAVVFRGEQAAGYPFLPSPRSMAFVAAAAYCCPRVRALRMHSLARGIASAMLLAAGVRVGVFARRTESTQENGHARMYDMRV